MVDKKDDSYHHKNDCFIKKRKMTYQNWLHTHKYDNRRLCVMKYTYCKKRTKIHC